MLNQTVTIRNRDSSDLYGKGTLGAPVEYAARVSATSNLVRDFEGKTVEVHTVIHMDGFVPVDTRSELTLSNGTVPVIVGIAHLADLDGTAYATRVECS